MKKMSAKDLVHHFYLKVIEEELVFVAKEHRQRLVNNVLGALINNTLTLSKKTIQLMEENPLERVAYAKRIVGRWLSMDPRNKVVPASKDTALKALLLMASTAPRDPAYRAEIQEHIEKRILELKRQKSDRV